MIRKGLRSVLFVLAIVLMAAIPATIIRSAEEKPDTQLTTDQALLGSGLTEEEKKWYKEKEKELLKKAAEMVTDSMEEGRIKTVTQYMIANVHDWSAFSGKLAAGDNRDALNLMATVGAKELNGYIEDRLPDGKIKDGYKFMTDNVDDVKAVAIAMLDRSKTWADVGNVAWDKTKEKTKKTLEEKSDELVKTVINYAFGDRSLLGYTPGDVYLLMVKTEMQVIDVWNQKYDMRKQNELYALYKAARDSGKGDYEAFDLEVSPRTVQGPYAKAFGRETSENEIRNMFSQCYGESSDTRDFGWWLRDKLREKLADAKKSTDASTVMENARQALQKDLYAYLDKVRKKQQELAEKELTAEIKKKRAAAVTEARNTLALLDRTAGQIKSYCQAFEGAAARLTKVFDTLKSVQTEVGNLAALVAAAQRASDYANDANRLSKMVTAADALYRDFETAVKNAEDTATRSCTNSEGVPQAPTKDQAKKLLDDCINEARKSSKEMTAADGKAKELKKSQRDFAVAVQAFTQKYSQTTVQEMQASINRITSVLALFQDGTEARLQTEFNSAIAVMRDAASKTDTLLAYGRGLQAAIKARLAPYPQSTEITDILTKTDAALTGATECAGSTRYAWASGDRWSTRQPPKFPKVDTALLQQARTALGIQDSFKSILSPTDAVKRMSEIAKTVDTRTFELDLARKMYEKCVQNAILAYNDKWLFKVEIAGPASVPVGDDVSLEARVTAQTPARYSFRWYADGKELGSQTNTQKVRAGNLGDHTISVVVWRWAQDTGSWVRAGEGAGRIKVVARLQRVDIAGPDHLAPKQRGSYTATLVPAPAEGKYGYTWSLDGRVIGTANTSNTQTVEAADAAGRHTLAVKVFAWANQQWQHVVDGSRAIDVQQTGSRVAVTVRDGSSPVTGARVSLAPGGANKYGSDVVFENVPTGRVTLTVSASGYLDESYQLDHNGASPSGSSHTFYLRRTGRSYTGR